MSYRRAVSFLDSFVNYERLASYPYKSRFRLERVQRLLRLLGNPEEALRIIHIAGTKGKGSTCAFAAQILKAAGFKVGLYTSPHLLDLRERIRILRDGKEDKISRNDFAGLIDKIKPYAKKINKNKLGRLSYYEVLTCLAFLYFNQQKCDFVVLETGIGGRLDATNAASSLVCAITPISYEHTQVLGPTLKKIAVEKAAIIKSRKQIVVTALQRPTVRKVIAGRVKSCGARFIAADGAAYSGLRLSLLGEHQKSNAALAAAAVKGLRYHGINISEKAIKQGLRNTRWPGRLQIIAQRPRIVLDGAQNRASALALKQALKKLFRYRNLILVIGVSQDKDVKGILKELLPLASRVILTRTANPRAMAPETIKTFIKTGALPVVLTENSKQALQIARQSAKQSDLILLCGSLFLVGEVLNVFR